MAIRPVIQKNILYAVRSLRSLWVVITVAFSLIAQKKRRANHRSKLSSIGQLSDAREAWNSVTSCGPPHFVDLL